ncbi:uncharacterized protein LOC129915097, partial [Episyrphus balteatus]|uniref:uncharacterized protein LOC129915097 n=1 Tax=Episyrphus balteatus TaxID=286459 RepID=UPI002485A27D
IYSLFKVAYYKEKSFDYSWSGGARRGRPRGSYNMSEFDVNLIREFESRPGFYDRNSRHFKDKIYNAQAWQDISNMLGYDVALLKDRMLQLRNRYNLEKRRLENLAEEYPDKIIQSQWPLYEHLHFLSDHIRPRRSYKRMLTRPSGEFHNSISNQSSSSGTNNTTNTNTNGLPTIKLENGFDDDDSEDNSNPDDGDIDLNFDASNSALADNDGPDLTIEGPADGPTDGPPDGPSNRPRDATSSLLKPISVKNIDSMRTIIPKENIRRLPPAEPLYMREKRLCLETTTRVQKFDAFGKFVTSSLIELPPEKALKLVEKFTSDIVRVLIEKNHSMNGDRKEPVSISDDDCH